MSTPTEPPVQADPSGLLRFAPSLGFGPFGLVVAQLALLVLVIRAYGIEEAYGFVFLAPWLLGGFIVHAWLPRRLRLPFFTLLGLGSGPIVLGLKHGSVLVAAGLGLIGICHLPVSTRARAGLLVAAGLVMAAMRAEIIPGPGLTETVVLPILGAMFMFRVVIYLYDLRHEKGPVSIWSRISYFFLLPNVCFPLFPVVDYQAFKRTYFDSDEWEIYQKGLDWILRGITHILLYRLIYQEVLLPSSGVTSLATALLHVLATYGLYLRISGQFHLIIGVVCLFGFNLPETHHKYFLATSFNDYWRRINIYWKDFMMKIFFYPMMMRLKRYGMTTSLVVATATVFLGTWLLHSYQWFWLQGSFPLRATDAVFWGILGLVVAANSVFELKRGRKLTRPTDEWSWSRALGNASKTVAMFTFMAVLWSLWSSPSVGEWVRMAGVATRSGGSDWILFTLSLLGLVALGATFQFAQHRTRLLFPGGWSVARSSAFVTVLAVGLVLVSDSRVQRYFDGPVSVAITAVQDERLNDADRANLERGYYEGLLDSPSYTSSLWRVRSEQPKDWGDLPSTEFVRRVSGPLDYELVPGADGVFNDKSFRTNRLGMRDRDYAVEKVSGTFRFALLGASYEMGSGVEGDETFESVVEERLNRELGGERFDRFEILNFGVGGYGAAQLVMVAEEKALGYDPDVLVMTVHGSDMVRTAAHIANVLDRSGSLGIPSLDALLAESGIRAGMTWEQIYELLRPREERFFEWVFERTAEASRAAGVTPMVVYVPTTDEVSSSAPQLLAAASRAGLITVDLSGTFDDWADREIQVAPWDTHPNALGHSLLAERLFRAIVEHATALGMTP